jgi:hypothetical protein
MSDPQQLAELEPVVNGVIDFMEENFLPSFLESVPLVSKGKEKDLNAEEE